MTKWELELPRWVWDILADVVEHEDVHGSADHCMERALNRMPEHVRSAATVILSYRSAAEKTGGVTSD